MDKFDYKLNDYLRKYFLPEVLTNELIAKSEQPDPAIPQPQNDI